MFTKIKNNTRYNSKLSFDLTGRDFQTIIEYLESYGPVRHLQNLPNYGSDKYVNLSGEEVYDFVKLIPCPSPCINKIINRLRYYRFMEYILTGEDVKCIIESLENLCGEPEPPAETHLRLIFGVLDDLNLPAWLSSWDNLTDWNLVLAAGLESGGSLFTSLVVDVDNAIIDFYGGIGCHTSFPVAPPWPSFLNYANIISVEDFDGCIVSWHHNFFNGSSLQSIRLHGATTMTAIDTGNHGRQFLSCSQLAEIYAPLCDGFGATVGDNDVFRFIAGNTIDATFMASLQTINAGGVEGDIAYLQANNTVNITWV